VNCVNFVGPGALLGFGHNLAVCNVRLVIDGVVVHNAAVAIQNQPIPAYTGFTTSLELYYLSGAGGGQGWVTYRRTI